MRKAYNSLMNNTYRYVCLVLCIVLMFGTITQVDAKLSQIPNWIRNNAKWWYQGQIQDSEFLKGIQYLIENKIMVIPLTNDGIAKENKIPFWVKNNAGWWANGTISDNDFISSIQYLVSSGVILIKYDMNLTKNSSDEPCNKFATVAEKETCIEQLEYDKKIKNFMKTVTPYVVGPVTFYYINSELQKIDGGKTLFTIHFIVQNNGNKEVTLTCQRPDSCNYALNDGQNEIPYSTNTLVYGSLTLTPQSPKFLDWTFYNLIDSLKNYTFFVKEPWGSGSIPIKIS